MVSPRLGLVLEDEPFELHVCDKRGSLEQKLLLSLVYCTIYLIEDSDIHFKVVKTDFLRPRKDERFFFLTTSLGKNLSC